jgi:hypothetical protein
MNIPLPATALAPGLFPLHFHQYTFMLQAAASCVLCGLYDNDCTTEPMMAFGISTQNGVLQGQVIISFYRQRGQVLEP